MELDRSRNSLRDAIRSAGQGSDPGKPNTVEFGASAHVRLARTLALWALQL